MTGHRGQRLLTVKRCPGCGDAILDDAEGCEGCNERKHDQSPDHLMIIGLGCSRFSVLTSVFVFTFGSGSRNRRPPPDIAQNLEP